MLSQQVNNRLVQLEKLKTETEELTLDTKRLRDEKRDLSDHVAKLREELAATALYAPPEKTRELDSAGPTSQAKPVDYAELVKQFSTADRLKASNQLVALYPKDHLGVVKALVDAVQPDNANSYRTNLYIAFTLARIPGGWEAAEPQYQRIQSLKSSVQMKDSTFSRWVAEALKKRIRPG
jgi:alanyl-tRNA synthetase